MSSNMLKLMEEVNAEEEAALPEGLPQETINRLRQKCLATRRLQLQSKRNNKNT